MQPPVNSKSLKNRRRLKIIGFLVLVMIYSCADYKLDDWERLDEMHADILALTEDANCPDSTQCRYIALGSKPCGGPWEFLIYCNGMVDSVRLGKLVNEYNQYEDELNHIYGRDSDCSMPPEPKLGFMGRRCVDLREQYYYQAYDSTDVLVVEGWFRIENQDSTFITGVWDFNPVGNPENIGPQTGNGNFIGYQDTAEIESLHDG